MQTSSESSNYYDRNAAFNNRQHQLVHQFSMLCSAQMHSEFSCPIGTELVIAIICGSPYRKATIESLVTRTGISESELLECLECLTEQKIVEVTNKVINVTDEGARAINEVGNKILRIFVQISERINNEEAN